MLQIYSPYSFCFVPLNLLCFGFQFLSFWVISFGSEMGKFSIFESNFTSQHLRLSFIIPGLGGSEQQLPLCLLVPLLLHLVEVLQEPQLLLDVLSHLVIS